MLHDRNAAPDEQARRRFGARIGPYHVLIAPHTLSEVVLRPVLYPLPHTPPWFLGMLNQRGNLLPVFDLHRVLQTTTQERSQHTVLVLDQGSEAVGMCIDSMPQSVLLEQRLPQVPPLPEPLAAYVATAYRTGTTTWLEFNHQGFFTTLGERIAAPPDLPVGL